VRTSSKAKASYPLTAKHGTSVRGACRELERQEGAPAGVFGLLPLHGAAVTAPVVYTVNSLSWGWARLRHMGERLADG
jgi:hypothetical protein